ncbi:glycoside hydrolase family 27 protein [Terriglobus sp.]|uniref:glycoside hydrolase family 27 protein n=1 Tax=Terriglobus sp. TaxID=1889013 RepID=UPI003B003753
MNVRSLISLLSLAAATTLAAQTSPAPTPPMGWNSWNHFAGKVTDVDVRATADQLVSTGMRDAGYVYVNIDDTWQGKRDASGIIHANEKFPDMKALADYVHSKGLKLGIYSGPGEQTCAHYEGSLGHEAQDAQTYAGWGIDLLKYDLCSFSKQMAAERAAHPDDPKAATKLMIAAYKKMGDALRATGRPILYSLCQYGLEEPWKWGPQVGASMWRTTDDINDTWARMFIIAQSQSDLAPFAGPGHWNDPDMLEVGNGGMKTEEYRQHMTLWAMLASPLLAGNDLTKMTDADKSILMNRDVIAIDQDPLGKQATRLYQHGDISVWTRPLTGNRIAVALVTASWGERNIQFDLAQAGFPSGANVRDVWAAKDLGHQQGIFTGTVRQHGVMLLILSK